MSISRRLARPLLAAAFITEGADAILRPDPHVQRFKRLEPALEKTGLPPAVTADTRLIVRASGAVSAAAGLALATGRAPRAAALTLAALNVPITAVQYQFWAVKDSARKKELRKGFIRGLSLSGGLLVAAFDLDGKPSLSWRLSNRRHLKAELGSVKDALTPS